MSIELEMRQMDDGLFLLLTDENIHFDSFVEGMLVHNKVEGLIPVERITENNVKKLRYPISGMIKATEYFQGTVSKKKLLGFLLRLTKVFLGMDEYMLSPEMLLLDNNYIYINKNNGELRVVCLPYSQQKEKEYFANYVSDIVFSVEFEKTQKSDYISLLLDILRKEEVFQPRQFLRILEDMDKEVEETPEPAAVRTIPPVVLVSPTVLSPQGISEPTILSVNSTNPLKTTSNPLKAPTDQYGQTSVLHPQRDSAYGQTTVLNNSMMGQAAPVYAVLIRKKNGEKVLLDKSIIRIGKERSCVDYFVSDNPAVSRSHASITCRNNRYYITDLESTNHTYVAGEMIVSKKEIELRDGDVIMLGNEEFQFKLN